MSDYTVLVSDYAWPSLEIEREILGRVGAELLVAESGDPDELVALAPRADAILTNWRRIPPEALDAAQRCLVVSRFGIGVDNIPVARATELGIVVTNVPAFCVEEVSDHTMALILACARRIVGLSDGVRRGRWNLDEARQVHRLRGQTLGLVGFGAIARAVVPKAAGFGLEIVAHSPRLDETTLPPGVRRASSFDELLDSSDFVSLHLPATTETTNLIGEYALRRMKTTAYLINTSRGALVDEPALTRAVAEGWIAGAAVDVLLSEPPPDDNPLLKLDGLIVTPHTAFYSVESVAGLEARAAANVATVLSGQLPDAIVNPDVLEHPNLRVTAR
jgi:D-3-phosphoglycerate dehydrogenase / 2-oxoglutarate reductase